jgi:hypothetical protein
MYQSSYHCKMSTDATDATFHLCDANDMMLYKVDTNKDLTFSEKDVFFEAIKCTSFSDLGKMGIQCEHGTVVRIAIVDHHDLWEKYKGQMLLAHDRLECFIEDILKKVNGILVKIIQDSFICFFPDKQKGNSSTQSIFIACVLHNELATNPIVLTCKDDLDHLERERGKKIHLQIVLASGPVFKRKLHIQKKVLSDYHGESVDAVLGYKLPVKQENTFTIIASDGKFCKHVMDRGEASYMKKKQRNTTHRSMGKSPLCEGLHCF